MTTNPTPLQELLQKRDKQTADLEALHRRVLNNDATVSDEMIDLALEARGSTDAAIAGLRSAGHQVPQQRSVAYDAVGRVGFQAEEYNAGLSNGLDGQQRSWLADCYAWQVRNDFGAMERLQRHAQRVMEDPAYEGARRAVLRSNGGTQQRALGTSGAAGLVPPTYLVNWAALIARNGRPFANALNRLPLEETVGMQLILPKETTGATTTSQATENTAVSSTDEVWANTTYNVATIAGQQVVSRQTLERGTPGMEQIIFADLAGAYSSQLDSQLFTGSGTSGQLLGISNAGTINTATLFGAAATVATYYTKVAGQQSAINSGGTVLGPVNLIVMHPRRWAWVIGTSDSTGRPLLNPGGVAGFNQVGAVQTIDMVPQSQLGSVAPQAVGTLQGIPVVIDANVPTTVGGGSTEDITYLLNTAHALLFEDGAGSPTQLRFEQTAGQNLSVTLVLYNYAVVAWRYLLSIGRVGGADATGANGTQAPTF